MNRSYDKLEKIIRWLLYGVFLCLVPLFLIAIFDWIAGYKFNLFRLKYFPDFLLMTFAIAANSLSYATDREKNGSHKVKNVCKVLSILSMFYCVIIYSRIDLTTILMNRKIILGIIAIIFCLINVIEGAVLEFISN